MANALERERLVAPLREQGLTEQEIQEMLGSVDPIVHEGESSSEEASDYDTDGPIDKETIAAAMREEGIPEQEIEDMLTESPDEIPAPGP